MDQELFKKRIEKIFTQYTIPKEGTEIILESIMELHDRNFRALRTDKEHPDKDLLASDETLIKAINYVVFSLQQKDKSSPSATHWWQDKRGMYDKINYWLDAINDLPRHIFMKDRREMGADAPAIRTLNRSRLNISRNRISEDANPGTETATRKREDDGGMTF